MRMLNDINGPAGYTFQQNFLSPEELSFIRDQVVYQYMSRLMKMGPQNYHDHAALWPKSERMLGGSTVRLIKRMGFFSKLWSAFGECTVTAEEGLVSDGEMYWRLVRPNEPTDVGPLHADRWFWELGGTPPSVSERRIKVWLPIYAEPGLSGLLVRPGSHRENWTHEVVMREGRAKPSLIGEPEMTLVPAAPGDVIIFSDDLIHGGALNRGAKTRVSLEFTLLSKSV